MNEGGELMTVEQQLAADCQGRSYAQALSSAVGDLVGSGFEQSMTLARKIGALGQVLVHQALGDLIGAALPWAL